MSVLDSFPGTGAAPLDQADGLRRMFAGRVRRFIPLVANPHVPFGSVALERVTTVFAAARVPVLLVDASDQSPALSDAAWIDLGTCVERLDEHTYYLAARGLPRRHVNTRGSAEALLQVLCNAAPQAAVIVLYGEPADLARIFQRAEVRPLLLCGDHPESAKHAYAAAKILAQRCGLMTFDLLMCAAEGSRAARAVATSMSECLENFLGAVLHGSAVVDPAADVADAPAPDLTELLSQQLQITLSPSLPVGASVPAAGRLGWPATMN